MTVFAGIVGRPGEITPSARVEAMLMAMRRGADTTRTVSLGHVALGRGGGGAEDPRPAVRGHCVAVGDVRLDALEHGSSDLEVALRAYAERGLAFTDTLSGDFALAIWDGERRRLVLVRDAFGVRTLRYAVSDERIAFATDTPGLQASGLALGEPNRARIGDFLLGDLFEGADATSTFLTRVLRLPAGHLAVFDDAGMSVRRWFRLRPATRRLSDAEAVDAFRTELVGAVARSSRSVARVGSTLSGGLDSASVVAVARDRAARPFPTISVVSPRASDSPDVEHIRSIIDAGRIDAITVSTDALEPYASAVREFVETTDDPYDAHVMCVPFVAFRAASEAGIGVVFDGIDGDRIAGQGPESVRYALLEGSLCDAWGEAREHARAHGRGATTMLARWGFVPAAWQCMRPWLPGSILRAKNRDSRRRYVRRYLRDSAIDLDLAREIPFVERARGFYGERHEPSRPADEYLRSFDSTILSAALERYDRAAAASGVEVRHPLLDRRLVETCASISWRMRSQEGEVKHVMRAAMSRRLPRSVLTQRRGPNLSGVTRSALLSLLHEWALDTLTTGLRVARGYVRPEGIRRMRDAILLRPMNVPSEVWQLITLIRWLDRNPGKPHE